MLHTHQKTPDIAILIAEKADFKVHNTRYSQSPFTRKRRIINLHAPNNTVSKYIKQKLTHWPMQGGEIKCHGGKKRECKHTCL